MSNSGCAGFCMKVWGKGAKSPPPRPTPHTPLRQGRKHERID